MSGLKNTFKRIWNLGRGKGYITNREHKNKRIAVENARIDKIYQGAQIPDDEVIKRDERRKSAKRQGSRANTVLTSRETLG